MLSAKEALNLMITRGSHRVEIRSMPMCSVLFAHPQD